MKDRIYYLIRIKDLRCELDFWRDTLRKLLYSSKKDKLTTDKIINEITKSLKTFSVNEKNQENIDEIIYLAKVLNNEINEK